MPSPPVTEGLRAQGPDGFPTPTCAFGSYNVYLSKAPPVTDDKYFTLTNVRIDAVAQVVQPVPVANFGCVPQVQDVTETSWTVTSRPQGSNAAFVANGKFSGNVKLDVDGQYVVTFVSCPNICHMLFPPNPPVDVQPYSQSITLEAVDSLPIPPQTKPIVADLEQCKPALPGFNVDSPFTDPFDQCKTTSYSDTHVDNACNGGGGVLNPEWVTVNQWNGVQDYATAEGEVKASDIARKDSPFVHSSQDIDFSVLLDSPYRYLQNSANTGWMPMEWETGSFPEQYRPLPGDRVSLFGYWVHDCGHPDYHTEIHPPVGVVTDKKQAILLPADVGTNVYAPGIQSDVYFNAYGGLMTEDCSGVTLHQPATDSDSGCIPLADSAHQGHASPIKRQYEYNIYLPQNPEAILKAAGKQNPPHIELYVAPAFDPNLPQPAIQFKQDKNGVGYLHVTIDLTNFNGTQYSGSIFAAWKYPAPDNWGLKRYQMRLNKLEVRDDSDWTSETLGWGGDFHLWAMTNHQTQWTKLMAGDDNEYDDNTDNFGGNPWETSSGNPDRSLGSDLFLFPEQLITFFLTGYEDDGIESSDGAGTVSALIHPPDVDTTYSQNNYCNPSDPEFNLGFDWTPNVDVVVSGCTDYTAYFGVNPKGSFTGQLSLAGQALYDASIVHASDVHSCPARLLFGFCLDLFPAVKDADWHPNGHHPTVPTDLGDFPVFEPQESEDNSWDDIDPVHLKDLLTRAPEAKLDKWLTDLKGLLPTWLRPDHPAMEFVIVEAALPPGKFQQYFGDVQFNWPKWGDVNCDGNATIEDAFLLLKTKYVGGKADCLNVGNVDCNDNYDVLDVLALARHAAGLSSISAATSNCPAIGADLHLTINLPSTSPTPTRTPTPTPTATPTATPSGSATATQTATPTPTPTPTPDTTGPTITNTGANPDGNAPNYIFDHPATMGFCPTTTTTISATVTDSSGINFVRLQRRFTGGGNPTTAFAPVTATAVGGNVYQVVVDPPTFAAPGGPNGTIDWFWEAQDSNGNISTTGVTSTTVTDCNPIL